MCPPALKGTPFSWQFLMVETDDLISHSVASGVGRGLPVLLAASGDIFLQEEKEIQGWLPPVYSLTYPFSLEAALR